jgi:hypothetical protein
LDPDPDRHQSVAGPEHCQLSRLIASLLSSISSIVDPDPHQSDKLNPDPGQQQSEKLDPDSDPHQFTDDKPKCMEYNRSLFEPFLSF